MVCSFLTTSSGTMAASSASPDFTCDPADIYGNGGHLMRHVLEKGWQAGGVVGLFVVTPIQVVRHYRATGSWDGKLDRALRIGRKGAIGTLLVAGVTGLCDVRCDRVPGMCVVALGCMRRTLRGSS